MDAPQSVIAAIFWVLGGLGLFLYGIDMMGGSLRKAAGSTMRRGINFLTRTRLHGLITGTIVTGLLQSSSATTVMVVGFISAGLLTFPKSMGLILGANIGTTITLQITAFDIDAMAVPLLGIGFIISFLSKKRVIRQLGTALMGFGMLFFGLILMKFAVAGYSETIHGWLEACIAGEFWGQLLAFTIAMIATAIIQSSGATVIMIQALAFQGAITNVEIAIPMILGADIGTCITAILASLQASKSAKKAAIAHLLFNVIGTLITVAAFNLYAQLIPLTAKTIPHQIANAHMAIKFINALIFLPFTRQLVWLVNLFVRGEDKLDASPAFLNLNDIHNPEKAFDNVRLEVQRMCAMCIDMTKEAVEAFFDDDEHRQEMVLKREDLTDDLFDSIADYVIESSASAMPSDLSSRAPELMSIMSDVERVGDHAENIVEISQAFKKKHVRLTDEAQADISSLLSIVTDMGSQVISLFDKTSAQSEKGIFDLHAKAKILTTDMLGKHEKRLREGNCTIMAGIVFTDIVTNLRRVANHLRNVAVVLGNHTPKVDRAEI